MHQTELDTPTQSQIPGALAVLKGYKVTQQLGQGGMGTVYLAEDLRLQRLVAIKMLSFDSDNTNNLQEARLLARLNHRHIVQVYDVVSLNTQSTKQLALIMEYVNGPTLWQLMQEQVIGLTQKLQLLNQISEALACAHQVGIIHCDLKSDNILLNDQLSAKISDFGISLLNRDEGRGKDPADHNLGSLPSHGSQANMSPEQLQRQSPDHRSDLFSLGILAFELIGGRHPFGSGSAAQIGERIVNEEVMDAKHLTPAIDPVLAELLNQLLSKAPQHRPQSSIDVTRRFNQIMVAQTQQAALNQNTVVLDDNRFAKSLQSVVTSKTNRKMPIMIATATIITLAAMISAFVLITQQPPEPPRQIAILPVQITNKGAVAQIQQDLVIATIDDAIRQTIVNATNMNLISRREVDALSDNTNDSIQLMAKATGATDIITTSLDCNNSRCNVTFSRLTGDNWRVQNRQHFPTMIENFTNIYSDTHSHLVALYPDTEHFGQPKIPLPPQAIQEQDYLDYIRLYHKVSYTEQVNQKILDKLQKLLTRSPYLFSAYRLFRETARRLYLENKEDKVLLQLQALIQNAPPEYKYSVFQSIDAFWLTVTQNKLAAAQSHIDQAIVRGADPSGVAQMQAVWHRTNNDLSQAIKSYQTALALRPSTSMLYNVALYYWLTDEIDQSKQQLLQLLEILPNHTSANQLLAAVFLHKGDIHSAIGVYEKIVSANPSSMDLSNLGLAQLLLGQHDKAHKLALRAVEKSPKNPTWLLNLADVELLLGFTNKAQAHYRQVIDLHKEGKDVKSWLERAQALVHINDQQAAIKALNQATKLAPDNGEVDFTAALVYTLINENISAVARVEEALASNIGVIWFNLAWFDGLCDSHQFIELMSANNNPQRCG